MHPHPIHHTKQITLFLCNYFCKDESYTILIYGESLQMQDEFIILQMKGYRLFQVCIWWSPWNMRNTDSFLLWGSVEYSSSRYTDDFSDTLNTA